MSVRSWWAYRALPALAARLGPRAESWLPPPSGDVQAGALAAKAAAAAVKDERDSAAPEADPAPFAMRQARYLLADRVDVYAMTAVGAAGLTRWARIEGDLPKRGAYLALTLHYGAGMWAHAAFGEAHRASRWLYAPVAPPADRWMAWLIQRRLEALQRVMGHAPLPTGGSASQIVRWWQSGGGVMALYDVPVHGHRRCVRLNTRRLGPVFIPLGLFQMAAQNRVPVYFYRCWISAPDGLRRVRIAPPLCTDDIGVLLRHAAAWWDEALDHDAAAWHFWPGLSHFQRAPTGAVIHEPDEI
ncbi:hypothetical protein Ttaiw_00137 [Tepidimonas taiwanensis]|uniref:Uncharacterized protein n=2 Tax=Tepidimonas taiwanensis TaxID=307486 RepID=A0A554XE14_9BURK|nr:hypothetical protein Ttaiw_00137 [Tepidimonas taiwanensis]